MVGDIGIHHTVRFIRRNKQIISSSKKDNYDSIEDVFTKEIKVLDNFKNIKIEQVTSDTIKIHGYGHTKQDAVMDAVFGLNVYAKEYVSSGTTYNMEGVKLNKDETINECFTHYIAMDAVNMFKNFHINKIEEKKEGSEITYIVHVSAQRGQLVEK
jgi:hypothetical protein